MPKCPKCGEIIYCLVNFAEEVSEYILHVDDGDGYYEYVDSYLRREEYLCPNCGQVLFTSEEEAVEFLKKLPECYGEYGSQKYCDLCQKSILCNELKN